MRVEQDAMVMLAASSVSRWLRRNHPCASGALGSTAPTKETSSPAGSNSRATTNRSASVPVVSTKSLGAHRAGDLDRRVAWRGAERDALVETVERRGARLGRVGRHDACAGLGGSQLPALPSSLGQRPGVRRAVLVGVVGVPHLDQYRRAGVPAVVDALEEVVEEFELDEPAVVGVVGRPVLKTVQFQPLLARTGFQEALHVAAQVQSGTAPVGRRQQGNLDLRPVGRPGRGGTRRAAGAPGSRRRSPPGSRSALRSVSVSSPHTSNPVIGLRGPRSPRPYCTTLICLSYQCWPERREDAAVV